MFGSSLSLTLRATRYGPALRLSKFIPDEFVEPKSVRPRTRTISYEKSPTRGLFS